MDVRTNHVKCMEECANSVHESVYGIYLPIILCQVTRLQRLRQTVAELLLTYIPKGYSVGLVAFNESTSIVAPLTEITSMSVREQLVDKLPQNTPGGKTSIGIALQQCVLVTNKPTYILTHCQHMLTVGDQRTPCAQIYCSESPVRSQ